MFIRACTTKNPKTEKVYVAHQLVETYQTEEGPRTRILLNLGRLDLDKSRIKELEALFEERMRPTPKPGDKTQGTLPGLAMEPAPELVAIVEAALRGETPEAKAAGKKPARPTGRIALDPDSLETGETRTLGPELAGVDAWDRLGVAETLAMEGFTPKEQALACALVVGRLVAPGSERKTHVWLTNTTALPEILEAEEFLKVGKDALYGISDRLWEKKDALEQALARNAATLSPSEHTVLLYDLSNVYLEGAAMGNSLAKRGHSKEKRSDCPLISFSLIVDTQGRPVASRIARGNQSEPETLPEALDRIEAMLPRTLFPGAIKPTLVMDRGIATKGNIALLRARGFPYCVVERRAVEKEYQELFESARNTFEWFAPHPDRPDDGVFLRKVALPEENAARVLVLSTGRAAKEEAMDTLKETRMTECLSGLRNSIRKGSAIRMETVGKRIGKIMARYPSVAKYYTITPVLSEVVREKPEDAPKKKGAGKKVAPAPSLQVTDLSWTLNVRREERKLLLGTYVVETSHVEMSSQKIWSLYTTLTRVEGAFRALKSDLGIRPVYHQTADRTRAHLFISILAYHLLSDIECRLSAQGETRSWNTIRTVLGTCTRGTITGSDPHTGTDYTIRLSDKPTAGQKTIFDLLGIKDFVRKIVSKIRRPKPAPDGETVRL